MLARTKRRLVIVGNGMAGARLTEEILARAPEDLEITVFGEEPHGCYNRVLLAPVLAGEQDFSEIVTHDRAWYAARGIRLIAGEAVAAIDRERYEVRGASGTTVGYDVLVLATGSDAVRLPLPGGDLPGVHAFRSIADVESLRQARAARAVVIGGGLLGLEAAVALAQRGLAVTVVHVMPGLMERQLDPVSAGLLADELRRRGIEVVTGARTTAITGDGSATGIALADGRTIAADMVVMAVGVRPRIDLARAAGLACGRGVIVDDALVTSDPRIHALGECAEHAGQVCGLLAPIWTMARVCADRITGVADTRYAAEAFATKLKVSGIETFSAGDFLGDAESDTIVFRDYARRVHKRLVLRQGRLVGAVLYGDARDANWYFDLLSRGEDLGGLRNALAFGPEAVAA